MNRQVIFGKDDLWIVILWSDEQLYDVVRGSEINTGNLKVNSICEVKYKRQTYSAKICFISNTKEEATRKLVDLENCVSEEGNVSEDDDVPLSNFLSKGKLSTAVKGEEVSEHSNASDSYEKGKAGNEKLSIAIPTTSRGFPSDSEANCNIAIPSTSRGFPSDIEANSNIAIPSTSRGFPRDSEADSDAQIDFEDEVVSNPFSDSGSSVCLSSIDESEDESEEEEYEKAKPRKIRKKEMVPKGKGKQKQIKLSQKASSSSSDASSVLPEDIGKHFKKKKSKDTWKRNLRKEKRRTGEPYQSVKGAFVSGKLLKPNPCTNCQNKCFRIDNDVRQTIFSKYYNLSSKEQRDFIAANVLKMPVKRRRNNNPPKRNATYEYTLAIDGQPKKVCRQFFLATLSISKKLVQYTIDHMTEIRTSKPDQRGKESSVNKTFPDILQGVSNFIEGLPAIPAHYTRASSNKKYLPTEYNKAMIYRKYKASMENEGLPFASEFVFLSKFREYNIGFQKAKKDKCLTCELIKMKRKKEIPITEDEKRKYKKHKREKKATYAEYKKDLALAREDPSTVVASFDMQKILTTPYADSTLLFYSRKYQFYNLSVYENETKRGDCFVWGESDGKRGALEISTCISKWLNGLTQRKAGKLKVILYCDNCPGQNKNKTMFSMLLYHAQKMPSIENIQLKFLLKGHTYMGADTIHSTISSFVKHRQVMVPSQWPYIIQISRTKPEPFVVTKLNYGDFDNWNSIQHLVPSNSRDDEHNPVKWASISALKFVKGILGLEVRYSYLPSEGVHTIQLNKRNKHQGDLLIPKAYSKKIPISLKKFKDLEKLCRDGIIPEDLQHEFLRLPYSNMTQDYISDTDESNVGD